MIVHPFLPGSLSVVIIARYLATKGLLEAFARAGSAWCEVVSAADLPIDFLALLIGYAISGERTLADFFERLAPFQTAFMALFGRRDFPHRSSLSRFLADVDRPCLEAFRTLARAAYLRAMPGQQKPLAASSRCLGRRYLVFDVDATRQAARQRALPCDPMLPAARRLQDGRLCARLSRAQAW